jgi:glutaredoxin 2
MLSLYSRFGAVKFSMWRMSRCRYCVRARKQWGKFITDVDEAVGLVKCDKITTVELLEKETLLMNGLF